MCWDRKWDGAFSVDALRRRGAEDGAADDKRRESVDSILQMLRDAEIQVTYRGNASWGAACAERKNLDARADGWNASLGDGIPERFECTFILRA